jgi:hypothetical protein
VKGNKEAGGLCKTLDGGSFDGYARDGDAASVGKACGMDMEDDEGRA